MRQFVTTVTEKLNAVLKTAAETAIASFDASYAAYNKAVEFAKTVLTQVISGEFKDLGAYLMELALDAAGISNAKFRRALLQSKEAITAILNDPRTFISNLIQAASDGFEQFLVEL